MIIVVVIIKIIIKIITFNKKTNYDYLNLTTQLLFISGV